MVFKIAQMVTDEQGVICPNCESGHLEMIAEESHFAHFEINDKGETASDELYYGGDIITKFRWLQCNNCTQDFAITKKDCLGYGRYKILEIKDVTPGELVIIIKEATA